MGWSNNDKYGSLSSGAHAAWKWVEFRTVEFSQTLRLLYDVLASRSRFMKRTFCSLTKRENVFATAVTSLIEHSKTQTEREAVWFVFSSSSALAPGATQRHTATDRRRTIMILHCSPVMKITQTEYASRPDVGTLAISRPNTAWPLWRDHPPMSGQTLRHGRFHDIAS